MKKLIFSFCVAIGLAIPFNSNAGFVIEGRVTNAYVSGQILYIRCEGDGVCVNVYIDNGKARISIPDLNIDAELVNYVPPSAPKNPDGTFQNGDYQFTLK